MYRPFAIALCSGLLLGGCGGDECTTQREVCGLAVDLFHDWPEGSYRFTFEADGEKESCTLARHSEGGTPVSCETELGSVFFAPGGQPRATFETAPREAALTVVYEEAAGFPPATVASGSWRPSYDSAEPWGEGCGICERAKAQLYFGSSE